MKIKLRAVDKSSPAKDKRRAEKARMGSCRNEDEKKAMKKADSFNKRSSGGATR